MAAQPIIAQTKRFTYAMGPEVMPSFRKIRGKVTNWIDQPVTEMKNGIRETMSGNLTEDFVAIGGHTFKGDNIDDLYRVGNEMKRIRNLPNLERIALSYIEAGILFAKAMVSKLAKAIEAKPPVA